MKLPLAGSDVARGSRGVGALRDRLRDAAWAKIAARVLVVVAGLATLGWIGRTRLAEATSTSPPPSPATATPPSTPPSTSTSTSTSTPTSTPTPTPTPTPPSTPTSTTCPAGIHARASPDDPIVLNTATLEDLERLPGIGARKAQMILAERQRLGRFRRIEDLMKVKGIGRGTIKRLRPVVRIDPPPQDAGAD